MANAWRDAVTEVLRDLAQTIAAGAPAGWTRAELRGYTSGPGAGHRGFSFEPAELNEYGSNDIDVFGKLREVHALTRAGERLTVEFAVESRGRYKAVLSEALERTDDDGFRYALRRDVPPPEGDDGPGGTHAPQAGDPREAVALLGAYLGRREKILDRDIYAPPPARPELRRRQLEDEIGVPLPEDLRALYAVIDGDGGEGLLDRHPWFGLEIVARLSAPDERWWAVRDWRNHLFNTHLTDYGPPLAMRRRTDHPAWIPFATSTGGDFLAVDMAPRPRGRPGQVIRIGTHYDEGPVYVADSVTSLLRRHVEALDAGAYRHEHGELWIDLGDMDRGPREFAELQELEVTGAGAAPIRGMHENVRHLTVRNAPWVDLGPVRGAPALWQVTMRNCPWADLSPLRETPVEVLDLSLDNVDLSGVAGHPTLRRVILRSEKPVDLRPLAGCPRLYGVDLAEAVPDQVSVLRDLPALLHLSMRREPWNELCAGGLPGSLAMAELAREPQRDRRLHWSFDEPYGRARPTLEDAVLWAKNLGGGGIWTFRGRFGR